MKRQRTISRPVGRASLPARLAALVSATLIPLRRVLPLHEPLPGARIAESVATTPSKPADSAVRAPAEGGFMASIRVHLLADFPPHEPSWADALALRVHAVWTLGFVPESRWDSQQRVEKLMGKAQPAGRGRDEGEGSAIGPTALFCPARLKSAPLAKIGRSVRRFTYFVEQEITP